MMRLQCTVTSPFDLVYLIEYVPYRKKCILMYAFTLRVTKIIRISDTRRVSLFSYGFR
jgi:hypothetical protein